MKDVLLLILEAASVDMKRRCDKILVKNQEIPMVSGMVKS